THTRSPSSPLPLRFPHPRLSLSHSLPSLHDALPLSRLAKLFFHQCTWVWGKPSRAKWRCDDASQWRCATSNSAFSSGKWEYDYRSEEHTSELQSRFDLVCRLLLRKKKTDTPHGTNIA